MAKAEFITYTEKEVAAIEVLMANRGKHLSAKELGISNVILSSLIKKSADERPMADGLTRVFVNKEDVSIVCPTCGNVDNHKAYWID